MGKKHKKKEQEETEPPLETTGEAVENDDEAPKAKKSKMARQKSASDGVKIEPKEEVSEEGKKKKPKWPKDEAKGDGDVENGDVDEKENGGNDPTTSAKPDEEDYQKEFTVLGHKSYEELKPYRVQSKWVENATLFPADVKEHSTPLDEVPGHGAYFKTKRLLKRIPSWFPVQRSVLPLLFSELSCPPVLRRGDIAISAPTGSGKTLCYILPLLASVETPGRGPPFAIVVAPVQTLVNQIVAEFERFKMGSRKAIKVVGSAGNEPFEKARNRLRSDGSAAASCDILVATPSRLVDHLLDAELPLDLSKLRFIVADEADRMMNARTEWLEHVERRTKSLGSASTLGSFARTAHCPTKILLSATLSRDVEHLEKWNLFRPRLFQASAEKAEQVDTTAQCVLPSSLSHTVLECPLKFHPLLLYRNIIANDSKKVLVFTNQRDSANRLCRLLSALGGDSFAVEQFTSDLFGKRRVKMLKRFKSGELRVLICSDVLSRGVDVEDIDTVVNYDIPQATPLFIHRAGRTARAGTEGRLVTLAEKDRKRLFVKMLKKGGLWKKSEEATFTEDDFTDDIDKYRAALEQLKKEMEGKNGNPKSGGKQENRKTWKNGKNSKPVNGGSRVAPNGQVKKKWK